MNIKDMFTLPKLELENGDVIELSEDGSGYCSMSVREALGTSNGSLNNIKEEMNPFIHTLYDQTKVSGIMGEAYDRVISDTVHPFVVAKLMEEKKINIKMEHSLGFNTDSKDRLKGLEIINDYGKLCSLSLDAIKGILNDDSDGKVEHLVNRRDNKLTIREVNPKCSHEEIADKVMYLNGGKRRLVNSVVRDMGYTVIYLPSVIHDIHIVEITDDKNESKNYIEQEEMLVLMVEFDPHIKNECIKLYHKAGKFIYSELLGNSNDNGRNHLVKVNSHEHLLFKEIAKETNITMDKPNKDGYVNISGLGLLLFATDVRVPSDRNMIKLLRLMIRQTLGFVNTSFMFSIFYSNTKPVKEILLNGLTMLLNETNEATVTQLLICIGLMNLVTPDSDTKQRLSNRLFNEGLCTGTTTNIVYGKVRVFDYKKAITSLNDNPFKG